MLKTNTSLYFYLLNCEQSNGVFLKSNYEESIAKTVNWADMYSIYLLNNPFSTLAKVLACGVVIAHYLVKI